MCHHGEPPALCSWKGYRSPGTRERAGRELGWKPRIGGPRGSEAPDLIGKGALNFTQVAVNLLAAVFVHGGTH